MENRIRRALISVYDKTGVEELCRTLASAGVEILSSGGTASLLEKQGIPVIRVADYTGFPEMLDGRVKTLHPAVHGGILARRDVPDHLRELEAHGIAAIDLVAVNLYPFVETISRPDVTLQDALEQIDIGGVTLLRAAAKNFQHVLVVSDPGDYADLLAGLRQGDVPVAQRRRLAQKAFQHTALYDTAIAHYLEA